MGARARSARKSSLILARSRLSLLLVFLPTSISSLSAFIWEVDPWSALVTGLYFHYPGQEEVSALLVWAHAQV